MQEEMNKDLLEWAREHGVEIERGEGEEEEKIEGKCEICGMRNAEYRCINCGKIACKSCFWTMLGICKDCVSEAEMKKIRKREFMRKE